MHMGMTIGPKFPQLPTVTSGAEAVGAYYAARRAEGHGESLRVSVNRHGTAEVSPAVEADIVRDDAIGGLFRKVFNLLAPPFEGLKV